MISTNVLSVFILNHNINRLRNKNIRSIQEIIRASEPAAKTYKKVCEDSSNLAILTKSATSGKVQLTFGHAAVGRKSLGEYVVAFTLTGDLSSPSIVSLKIDTSRRRQRPHALKEAARLDAAQRRPPLVIPNGSRNPPREVGHGQDSEDFFSLHHGVSK